MILTKEGIIKQYKINLKDNLDILNGFDVSNNKSQIKFYISFIIKYVIEKELGYTKKNVYEKLKINDLHKYGFDKLFKNKYSNIFDIYKPINTIDIINIAYPGLIDNYDYIIQNYLNSLEKKEMFKKYLILKMHPSKQDDVFKKIFDIACTLEGIDLEDKLDISLKVNTVFLRKYNISSLLSQNFEGIFEALEFFYDVDEEVFKNKKNKVFIYKWYNTNELDYLK